MSTNKQIKTIDKILAKETKCNEIYEKITQIKEKLAEYKVKNKDVAKQSKELKKMLPKTKVRLKKTPEKPLSMGENEGLQHYTMG